MFDHSHSQYADERREIIERIKDEDPKGWECFLTRFQIRNLFMMHPLHATLSNALEKHLERAARLKFENDREEAASAAIEVYYTIYLIVGDDHEVARRKAEDLGDSGSRGSVMNALGGMF